MARKSSKKKITDPKLEELKIIKKLLILQLLNSNVKADSIAKVLGMTKGNFSIMFPAKKLLR